MSRRLRVVAEGSDVAAALDAALDGGDAILVAPPGVDPSTVEAPREVDDRVALVVETSGSTGRPKRVAISADALLGNARASSAALGAAPRAAVPGATALGAAPAPARDRAGDRPAAWLLALPTHYIAGLNVLARARVAGAPAVRAASSSPADVAEAATRLGDGPRFVALVPAQLSALLDDPAGAAALRGFARVLVGGQATPASLLARAAAAGVAVSRSYGSSETSGGAVIDGRPVDGVRVAIVDGEVRIAGPGLAVGYLGDPERTAERFVEVDGTRWFRTADGGRLDRDPADPGAAPRLVVTGRLDDVLVSGGVKVALGEVERVLRELPGFDDAVVVRAPHARWGEAPVAFVPRAAAGAADAAAAPGAQDAAAIAEVGRRLGPPARPARIVALERLPRLASGKPDRRELERMAAAGSGAEGSPRDPAGDGTE
jgi:o-succinylbenzoate---CoA ligase